MATMTLHSWSRKKAGRSMDQMMDRMKSQSFDYNTHIIASNWHHTFGNKISMHFFYPYASSNQKPIPISISENSAKFTYYSILTISSWLTPPLQQQTRRE